MSPLTKPAAVGQIVHVRPLDRAAQRAVDRALSDLRRGEPVVVAGADHRCLLVVAAEGATAETLADLDRLAAAPPVLLVTGRRARALGFDLGAEADATAEGSRDADVAVALAVPGRLTVETARGLADPSGDHAAIGSRAVAATVVGPSLGAETAALDLVKLARLLPAAVVAVPSDVTDAGAFARSHDLLAVRGPDVADYLSQSARSLFQVVAAEVPLDGAEKTRLLAFRPSDGGAEHLAIVIGDPPPDRPVLVRLHSECFTGDLLGSLRCDCGQQLRGAVTEIAAAGGGVLLYLAQEGRGIGLINKLRAYRLQDGGLDTVDANLALGFGADERIYLPAAAMLKALGHGRVRLMTNNPEKLLQLARCGIEVVERVPHVFPANGHNRAYLQAKIDRSGHLF